MLRFALAISLICTAPLKTARADDLNLVRDVHIDMPSAIISAENAGNGVIWHTSSFSTLATLTAGRLLLHRYGCITCHDLKIPLPARPRGPSLDLLAHKTNLQWLRRWLRAPSSYLVHNKMPNPELSSQDIGELTSFLMSQKPTHLLPAAPERTVDPYRGAELYANMECARCHGGEKSKGPALDRIGEKVNRRWLYAFLKAPHLAQPSTTSQKLLS